MKNLKFTLLVLAALGLAGCKKDVSTEKKPKDSLVAKKDSAVVPEIHKEYYGIYMGDFAGKEMITPEFGEEYEGNVYKKLSLILDEPGNDKTDGRFEIKLKNDSITGKWTAFNKAAVKAPLKNLKLIKKEFAYNPNFMLDENSDLIDWENPKDFKEKYTDEETGKTETYTESKNRIASDAVFKINASKQKLTEKDLKNLRKLDMEIIKNAVFARHGYAFKKPTYRYFFEQTDWYIPVSNNVDNELSPMEKDNVALLNRFIKYAEDKYDSFGR